MLCLSEITCLSCHPLTRGKWWGTCATLTSFGPICIFWTLQNLEEFYLLGHKTLYSFKIELNFKRNISASIFMVEEQIKQKIGMKQVSSRASGLQKIEIFITTAVRTSNSTYNRNIVFISSVRFIFLHDNESCVCCICFWIISDPLSLFTMYFYYIISTLLSSIM